MDFMRLVLISSLLLTINGCSNEGGGSSKAEPNTAGSFNPDDFTLTQSVTLEPYGEANVKVVLKNMAGDDPVYMSISSNEQDNGLLVVKPYRALVNPNKGEAEIDLELKDQGLIHSPNLRVSVTTSGNNLMEQELAVEFGK